MKKLLFIFTLYLQFHSAAQNLKPSIGLGALPADAATICAIPVYTGSFGSSGLQAGDTIPHFQLYDISGNPVDILPVLQTGKPLLLISGAYTCPVFRQKIATINSVAATYTGQINVLVVYVVEAHPKYPDPSPYSGTLWVTSENQSEGVLFNQPVTYGDRKQILNTMLANPLYTLSVPVLLDGPCNAWWQNFGPAPNNAYLIKPDGVVYKKHPWFDKAPENIVNDINAILSVTGIAENNTASASLYPNPAGTELQIRFQRNVAGGRIDLFDATGKKTISSEFSGTDRAVLQVIDLDPGLYLYTIITEQGQNTGRVVIE